MHKIKLLIITLSLSFSAFAADQATQNRILYLMQAGQTASALELYRSYENQEGKHDFELLQQMALSLLDQGFRSTKSEIQLMTIYGAGIAANEKALYILQEGMGSKQPEIQMICLNFLSNFHNDSADEALNKAMTSDHLLIRLEAAHYMAQKRIPKAVGLTESLMSKVHPELHPIFPQLFAMAGTDEAMKVLRRLLASTSEAVRVEAILSCAKYQRDDLLPKIRILAKQHDLIQQEACAFALGHMKDEMSIPKLEQMARSNAPYVRLAALQSLYNLGQSERAEEIKEFASQGDVFAIYALRDVPEGKDLLAQLMKSENIQIRTNATLSLLEQQDPRCLKGLPEILVRDSRDLAFIRTSSPSKALNAWKVVPSARHNLKENPIQYELALSMREEVLQSTLELPEKDFLAVANLIFQTEQNDLVPLLSDLLRNHETPLSIMLLKQHQQKAGAPLIRNYCNLALYRMKQDGPYNENLRQWVTKQKDIDLIRFRTFLPWEARDKDRDHDHESRYQLTPEDTSRLLIESFEAFVQTHDDKGIDILLEAIQNGNSNNKYALAGLLMRAVQ